MTKPQLTPLSAVLRARRVFWAAPFLPGLALANPSGAEVVSGDVAFANPDANTLHVNQGTASAAINWQSFSIEAAEYVIFNQPSASSVVLNRVVGGMPSEIFGHLVANGRVFLINPQGVLFAPGSQVDVGGLVASTLEISDEDFAAGRYRFVGDSAASVVNAGSISASPGGFVVLIGDNVQNSGLIQAQLGQVVLASGSAVTMDLAGDGISYAIDSAALSDRAGVKNVGQIIADGGRVVMAASTAQALARTVVNNEGLVQAQSIIEGENGEIILAGVGGDVVNAGTLDASGTQQSPNAGNVRVTSDRDITLNPGSTILARGANNGHGGDVRIVGEGDVLFAKGATIDVSGGAPLGGGFVEVSGHEAVRVRGTLQIGRGGTFLLDPVDLFIANGAGTSASTGTNATVYEQFIENQLRSGVSVNLVASNSITLQDLTDGALDGRGTGAGAGYGGGLLLGIGNSSGSFVRGPGQSSGGIFFDDLTDSIKVDGFLNVIAGLSYGSINVGNLTATNLYVTANGNVKVGDVTVTANPNGGSNASANIQAANGAITAGDISVTGYGGPAAAWLYGQRGVTTRNITITGSSTGYSSEAGPAAQLNINAQYGDIVVGSTGTGGTADISVSGTNGRATVNLAAGDSGSGYGNIAVYGGISVTGGGGSNNSLTDLPVVADMELTAQYYGGGVNAGGNITVDGDITVTASPVTINTNYSFASQSGTSFSYTVFNTTGTFDAYGAAVDVFIKGDRTVDLDDVSLLNANNAWLHIQANESIQVRGITVNTNVAQFARHESYLNSFYVASSCGTSCTFAAFATSSFAGSLHNVGYAGLAEVDILGGSGSPFLSSRIELGPVVVTGGIADLSIRGGSVQIDGGTSLNAVAMDMTAAGQYSTSYGNNSSGTFSSSNYGGYASAFIEGVGSSSGVSVKVNGDVQILGVNAQAGLNVQGYGDVILEDSISVQGAGQGFFGGIQPQFLVECAGPCFGSDAAAELGVFTTRGDIVIGSSGSAGAVDVDVLATSGAARVGLHAGGTSSGSGYGDVTVWGGITVSGGGGYGDGFSFSSRSFPSVANLFLSAYGSSSGSGTSTTFFGGNVIVDGAITVTGNAVEFNTSAGLTPYFNSSSSYGSLSYAGTALGGNAGLGISADATVDIDSATVSAYGGAGVFIRGGQGILVRGALTATAEAATGMLHQVKFNLGSGSFQSSSGNTTFSSGHADVHLLGGSFSFGSSPSSSTTVVVNPASIVQTGAITVTGPTAQVEVRGGTVTIGDGTTAIQVTGAGSSNNSYGTFNGAPFGSSASPNVFGNTNVYLQAIGGTSGSPSLIADGDINVSQAYGNAFLTAEGSHGVTVNGNIGVQDNGGSYAQASVQSNLGDVIVNGDINVHNSGSGAQLYINAYGDASVSGSIAVSAVEGYTQTDLYAAYGDITVGGPLSVAAYGSSDDARAYLNANNGSISAYGITVEALAYGGDAEAHLNAYGDVTVYGGGITVKDYGGNGTTCSCAALLDIDANTGNVRVDGDIMVNSQARSGILDIDAYGNIDLGNVHVEGSSASASFTAQYGGITTGNLTLISDLTGVMIQTSAATGPANITGNLSVTANGPITQTGALDVDGTTLLSADYGGITLDNLGNDFGGAVSANNIGSSNDIVLTDANSIVLGTINTDGDLSVQAYGGGISQNTGGLTVDGSATFLLAPGNDLLLASAANNFAGAVTITGANALSDVALRNVSASAAIPSLPGSLNDLTLIFDNAAIALPGFNLSGNLLVVSGGAITQSGALTVSGTTGLTAGSPITLTNTSNDFTGAVSASNTGANAITLTDANAIVLGTISAPGNLTVNAIGITQDTGGVTVGGIATLNGGAGVITLNTATNDFTGAVTASNTGVNAITLTDANAILLGTISTANNLTVNGVGITQNTGGLTVGGTSLFNGGAGVITLGTATNNFTGAVSASNTGANAISLKDANAILLGTINTANNLTVNAVGITQNTGGLSVGGTATFNGGAGVITLNTATNDFTGAVTASNTGANAISLTDANAILLGTISTTNNLTVNGVGITQNTGSLTVGGTSLFTGGAGVVTLATATNDFGGAVSIGSATNATLVDATALTLGSTTITGNLVLDAASIDLTGAVSIGGAADFDAATGGISDSGAGSLSVTGTTLLDAAGNIVLDAATNDFGGAVGIFAAPNVTLVDVNALSFGPVTTTGNLTADAASISITGAVTIGGNADLDATTGGITDTAASSLSVTGTTLLDAAADIVLDSATNSFGGAVSLTAASATLVDANSLTLSTVTTTGALKATASGAILLSGHNIQSSLVELTAATSVTDAGAGSITAGAIGVSAGSAITLDETTFDIGTGTAPFGADPDMNSVLTSAGLSPPASSSPNAAFAARDVTIEAGNLSMAGDHLFLQADVLDLGSGLADVPATILVHYTPFTPNAAIHVYEDLTGVTQNANELYVGHVQHFDRFPGTTHYFGGTAYAGDIGIAPNGTPINVQPDETNFVFVTDGSVSGQGGVSSNGTVFPTESVFAPGEETPVVPSDYEPGVETEDEEEEKPKAGEDELTDQENGDDSGSIAEQSNSDATGECGSAT